jgi:hypothetical protein
MSLDQSSTVDAIGIENDTGAVVLTIADYWDWTEERQHLVALQEKLNTYFEFIETRQVWDVYPAARGRQLVIDVVSRFQPPTCATEFMKKAAAVAAQLNVILRQKTFPGTAHKSSQQRS